MIEVKRRPYPYSFSGNPVHYRLFSELAAADDTIFFEVKVLYKLIADIDYTELVTYPYTPKDGFANIDIKDIINSILTFETPAFGADEKTPTEAPKQTGNFYIQFREITLANPDPSWNDSEKDYACIGIKGGISYFKWRGNNFWVNYFDVEKPFLTWQIRGRLASLTERMYLLWLNRTDLAAADIRIQGKLTYTDGSFVIVAPFAPFVNAKGNCYYIPAGCDQLFSAVVDAGKKIYFWEVAVYDYSDGDHPAAVTELFRYYADNRNDYNDITLHYRGSLGSLDSSRIRGLVEEDLNFDFTEQDATYEPDYFSGDAIAPRRVVANGMERKIYKVDIGYLQKEEQDRLRDTNLNRNLLWEKNKKWWPYINLTPSQKQKDSNDQLWSFPLQFASAIDGDPYYTPDNVDLGDGLFTENVCLAYLFPVTIGIDDGSPGNKTVIINATEVDPQIASDQFRYRVLKQSDNSVQVNWTTKNIADLPLSFELPEDVTYVLEYQSICTNNIFGKKSTAQFTTTPAAGVDDSSLVNWLTSGSAFSIKVNDVVKDSGVIGAGPVGVGLELDSDASLAAIVKIVLTSIIPSSATIGSNGVTKGTTSIALDGLGGCTVTFEAIDIVLGVAMLIE